MYEAPVIEAPTQILPPPESHDASASDAGEATNRNEGSATREIKARAKEAILKDESGDMEAYVQERRDESDEADGKPLSSERKQARTERYRRALEAAQSADDLTGGEERQSSKTNQESPEGHQEANGEDWHREADKIRSETQFEMRATEYAKSVPDFFDTVKTMFEVAPLNLDNAAMLIKSPKGPEIGYLLATNPDAIFELNALPPDQAKTWIARMEGKLMTEGTQRASQPAPRRATRAPRPLSTVRGGTGGNFDPNTASMDEYAARRKSGWRG